MPCYLRLPPCQLHPVAKDLTTGPCSLKAVLKVVTFDVLSKHMSSSDWLRGFGRTWGQKRIQNMFHCFCVVQNAPKTRFIWVPGVMQIQRNTIQDWSCCVQSGVRGVQSRWPSPLPPLQVTPQTRMVQGAKLLVS